MKGVGLLSGAVLVAGAQTAPDVPWWGHLIMALVTAALAFFGGRANAASNGR